MTIRVHMKISISSTPVVLHLMFWVTLSNNCHFLTVLYRIKSLEKTAKMYPCSQNGTKSAEKAYREWHVIIETPAAAYKL